MAQYFDFEAFPPLRANGGAAALRFARRNGVHATHRLSHCVRRPIKKKNPQAYKACGKFQWSG